MILLCFLFNVIFGGGVGLLSGRLMVKGKAMLPWWLRVVYAEMISVGLIWFEWSLGWWR